MAEADRIPFVLSHSEGVQRVFRLRGFDVGPAYHGETFRGACRNTVTATKAHIFIDRNDFIDEAQGFHLAPVNAVTATGTALSIYGHHEVRLGNHGVAVHPFHSLDELAATATAIADEDGPVTVIPGVVYQSGLLGC